MNEFTSLNASLSSNVSSISRLLSKYNQAVEDIDKEIANIYQRYDGIVPKSATFRKGQLESLKAKILNHIIQLGNMTASEATKKALNGFEQGYYKTAYEIDKKSGFNIDFTMLNTTIADSVLLEKFDSKTFSERVWDNTAKLAVKAEQAVNKAVTYGESTEKLSRKLKKEFNSGFYEASRVINTETARAVTAGQIKAYKNSGVVKWVMWDATLESNTCLHCGEKDGDKYEIDDIPYLPEHPNCRCCLVPVVDDWQPAKKLDNESKEIIEYQNYNDWYDIKIKKDVANSSDNAIMKDSRSALGNNNSFIDFDSIPDINIDGFTDQQNQIIKQHCVELLKKASAQKQGVEVGGCYSLDDLTNKIINIGDNGKVVIGSMDKPFITIHNHPSNSIIGLQDVEKAIVRDLEMLTMTVGNQGKISYVKKSVNTDDIGYKIYIYQMKKDNYILDNISFEEFYKHPLTIIKSLNNEQKTKLKNNLEKFERKILLEGAKYGYKFVEI